MRGTNSCSTGPALFRLLSSTAIGVVSALLAAVPGRAALVSVCSGVSLPPSVVTGIVAPVLSGIVSPIQSTLNPIIGLPAIGGLLGLPPLSINLVGPNGLLTNAAAGAPISLSVLKTDGTVLGPADTCQATADALTLTTPAGISLGGNVISGLGGGLAASAGEIGSVALGNGAITGAAAIKAVAVGNGAVVTAANSVALGAGSTATRGATAGSAGEVSIGAPGATRQITNVAAGVAATDAANVGQLAGAIGTATANAVQYDTVGGVRANSITLAGGALGPVVVTNVAAGSLAPGSTDAVNGSQLGATNTTVAGNTTAITNLTNGTAGLVQQVGAGAPLTVGAATDGTSVNFTGTAGVRTLSGVGAGIAATDAVNLGQVGTLIGASAAASPLQYANAGAPTTPTPGVVSNDTTLVGLVAGTPVALHNVAAGTVSATSTDAVNGSQLAATNTQVTTNTADIATNTSNIAGNTTNIANLTNGTAGLVQQTGGAPGTGQITIAAATGGTSLSVAGTSGNRTLTGLSNGLAGNDAVTVAQVNGLTMGGLNNVQYDPSAIGGRSNSITLAGGVPGTVSITNVGVGSVTAGSTDAINGGQLAATNAVVASLVGGTAGAFRSDNTAAAPAPVASGANATAGGFGASATGTNGLALGNGAVSTGTGSVALGAGSVDGGAQRVVSIGGVGSERRLTNVSPGVNGTDAVNLSQLQTATTTFNAAAAGLQGQIDSVNFDLRQVRRRANGGTAGAMAVAGLPQAFEPGKSMVSGAVGFWQDQVAFAVGASTIVGEQTVLKAGASISGQGVGGFNAGVGYQF